MLIDRRKTFKTAPVCADLIPAELPVVRNAQYTIIGKREEEEEDIEPRTDIERKTIAQPFGKIDHSGVSSCDCHVGLAMSFPTPDFQLSAPHENRMIFYEIFPAFSKLNVIRRPPGKRQFARPQSACLLCRSIH